MGNDLVTELSHLDAFFTFLPPVRTAKQNNKMKLISVLHSFALFFKSRLYYLRRYTPACAKPPVSRWQCRECCHYLFRFQGIIIFRAVRFSG